MARRVFFSFNFKRDCRRVAQVRHAWLTGPDRDAQPFLDGADWEAVERQGDAATQRWIDNQLKGTSVTVVLVGQDTANRRWVQYEIEKSFNDGKGLLGIRIHNLKDPHHGADYPGPNPFDLFTLNPSGKRMSDMVPLYDWDLHDARKNIGNWIEKAAKAVGR